MGSRRRLRLVAAVSEPCIDLDEQLPSCSCQPDGSGQHDDQALSAHETSDLLPADLASHPDTIKKPGTSIAELKQCPRVDDPLEWADDMSAAARSPASPAGAKRVFAADT